MLCLWSYGDAGPTITGTDPHDNDVEPRKVEGRRRVPTVKKWAFRVGVLRGGDWASMASSPPSIPEDKSQCQKQSWVWYESWGTENPGPVKMHHLTYVPTPALFESLKGLALLWLLLGSCQGCSNDLDLDEVVFSGVVDVGVDVGVDVVADEPPGACLEGEPPAGGFCDDRGLVDCGVCLAEGRWALSEVRFDPRTQECAGAVGQFRDLFGGLSISGCEGVGCVCGEVDMSFNASLDFPGECNDRNCASYRTPLTDARGCELGDIDVNDVVMNRRVCECSYRQLIDGAGLDCGIDADGFTLGGERLGCCLSGERQALHLFLEPREIVPRIELIFERD